MGAWIEIKTFHYITSFYILVAPFMGAWIEIRKTDVEAVSLSKSHPSWVRGLKFCSRCFWSASSNSRTLHGCVD